MGTNALSRDKDGYFMFRIGPGSRESKNTATTDNNESFNFVGLADQSTMERIKYLWKKSKT
jgi:hypothetical protein